MKFELKRDLVFFDIESTGLHVLRDRIIQLGLVKYHKDGSDPVEKEYLVNPGVPIAPEAMAVHGITPDKVRNKPVFSQVAEDVLKFIGDADLAGYNSDRFDIPMLVEEFHRAGIDFDLDSRRTVDVQRIFYKMEPRTLKAALKYYCGKDLVDAHDALADVRATAEVLMGQIKKYEGVEYIDRHDEVIPNAIQNDIEVLSAFTSDLRTVDATQRMRFDENRNIVFNFGKHESKLVGETLYKDRPYLNWILQKEFSAQVKQIVKKEVKAYEKKLREES